MKIEVADAYRAFESHISLVNFDKKVFEVLPEYPLTDEDYKRCKLAANDISYQLLGMLGERGEVKQPWYWKEKQFAGKGALDIELSILRDQKRGGYGMDSKYGKPSYLHGLTAMKLMFPKTDITPVLADIVKLSFLGFTYGRKYLHLLGSMDAGKSSSTARLAMLYMLIDAEHTFVIVANPLLESADMTIYGDLTKLYNELCVYHPLGGMAGIKGTSLFPDAVVEAKRRINFTKDSKGQKAGWAALRSLKKEGVGIGAKGQDEEGRNGVGLYVFDEIGRVQGFRFKEDLVNVAAQDYFQMHSTQNPRDEMDVGGMVAQPKKWMDWGWGTYDEIRKDHPVIWPTVDSGIAYRINGLDAANIRVGKVIYPYQFKKSKLAQIIEDKGESSAEYFSQVLGMFPGTEIDTRLLSQSRMLSSRHDDEFYSMKSIQETVMFADPAHTGMGDNAVIGTAQFGPAVVTMTDGTKENTDLLIFRQGFEYVKFINMIPWQNGPTGNLIDFNDRFAAIGGDFNSVTPGAMVSYEQQIALRMAEIAKEKGIPLRNIGYDYSMRPEMVEAVTLMMGANPIAFNYNSKPIGYQLIASNENTAAKCKFRTDELAYLTTDLFSTKQIRGGNFIMAAIIQMCKTKLEQEKPDKPVQKKAQYKMMNGNKSPDERDTLWGLTGMAFLRGFRQSSKKTSMSSYSGSVYQMAKQAGLGRLKTSKAI